uniref:Uncharacterized protein n=1 Tax=Oryza rufipogon TaxID=4529 RepID=A0A0E0NAK2_ORYRU
MDRGRKQGRMKKEAISMYSLVPAHRCMTATEFSSTESRHKISATRSRVKTDLYQHNCDGDMLLLPSPDS